ELAATVGAAVDRLRGGWAGAFTVRSSSVHEDTAGASYAGLHTSVVVPPGDGVLDAVIACWRSLESDAARAYRARLGLQRVGRAMGVVAQRFVDAGSPGVACSADPVTGDRGTVVINAGWGTGAAVAGGHTTPDEYRVESGDGVARLAQRNTGRQERMSVRRD